MADTSPSGILRENEHHPAARAALEFVDALPFAEKALWLESLSSSAIAKNRMAEVCAATLSRVMSGQGVGERYILGLAYVILRGRLDDAEGRAATGLKARSRFDDSSLPATPA